MLSNKAVFYVNRPSKAGLVFFFLMSVPFYLANCIPHHFTEGNNGEKPGVYGPDL